MDEKLGFLEIDQIINGEEDVNLDDNLIDVFCVRLATTVPEANPGFQKKLEALLLEQLANQNKTGGCTSVQPHHPLLSIDRLRKRVGGLFMKKKFVYLVLTALVAAILTAAFVPGVQTFLVDVIKIVILGPYTQGYQVETSGDFEPEGTSYDGWIIKTDIGNYGGNTPSGVDPVIRTVNSFEEAQGLTNFILLAPGYLPEGYTLQEIKLAPEGIDWVMFFYDGPSADIIIVQMYAGEMSGDDPTTATGISNLLITDGTMEEVDFDGRQAVWVEDNQLMWEEDNRSIAVGGLDLDLETAMQIARSLH
jgi:hypothetical protein